MGPFLESGLCSMSSQCRLMELLGLLHMAHGMDILFSQDLTENMFISYIYIIREETIRFSLNLISKNSNAKDGEYQVDSILALDEAIKKPSIKCLSSIPTVVAKRWEWSRYLYWCDSPCLQSPHCVWLGSSAFGKTKGTGNHSMSSLMSVLPVINHST